MHDAQMRDPLFIAELERAQPPAVLARAAQDSAVQVSRLEQAGWRCRAPANDGVGIWDHPRRRYRIIHSLCLERDGQVWAHVSLSHESGQLPGWYELRDAFRLLYPYGKGIVVIPPADEHFSQHEVMHVWHCLDADPLPDFRKLGQV